MREWWSYDKVKRADWNGTRWHFVMHDIDDGQAYRERPVEWFFRNDDRTVFGVFRFAHGTDNPYRDYETMIDKIMNKRDFRDSLLDPTTKEIWRRNWK
jgi:hypothetical protein